MSIKKSVILALLLLGISVSHADAQIQNKFLFWGSAGYSSLLTDAKNIDAFGNVGFGFGGGYEFQANRFKIHTGIEYVNLRSNLRLNDFTHSRLMLDTEDDEYMGHFKFSGNKDRYKFGYVNIPLMFGGQFGHFYFLVGGKFGLNLSASSTTESTIKSTSTYPAFMVDFENMPNHFFTTVNEETKYKIAFEQNISAAFEMGFYLKKEASNIHYRFSLFCDYGLNKIYSNPSPQDVLLSKYGADYFQPVLNNFLLSNQTKVNALYAGLKFTLVLSAKKQASCRCEEYVNLSNRKLKKRKGNSWDR